MYDEHQLALLLSEFSKHIAAGNVNLFAALFYRDLDVPAEIYIYRTTINNPTIHILKCRSLTY